MALIFRRRQRQTKSLWASATSKSRPSPCRLGTSRALAVLASANLKPHHVVIRYVCFLCGKPGHHKRDCPTPRDAPGAIAVAKTGKTMARKNQANRPPAQPKQNKPVPARPPPVQLPCRFFQKGACQKKDSCPFSHAGITPAVAEPCKYHLSDSCLKGEQCPYSHDLKHQPCRFFHLHRDCQRGAQRCRFSHDPLSAAELAALVEKAAAEAAADATVKPLPDLFASSDTDDAGEPRPLPLPAIPGPLRRGPPAGPPAAAPAARPVAPHIPVVPGQLAAYFAILDPARSPFS